MLDATPILIKGDETVLDALERLEATGERMLICVNDSGQLAGVITDGDVREAILESGSLEGLARDVMNPNPVSVSVKARREEVRKLLSTRVLAVPVTRASGEVVGYYNLRSHGDVLDIRRRRIVIVGMGYVGTTLAVAFARAGFEVKGVDRDPKLLARLRARRAPFFEEGLQLYLEAMVGQSLSVHEQLEQARGEIYVITVGTPVHPGDKTPDVRSVESAARAVGKVLAPGDLVVMRSTVPISCTRDVVIPALEKESDLRAGEDFHVSFAPERTAEGRALVELSTNPQIVGGHDDRATELTLRLFTELCSSVTDVGSLEAAEFCKLIDNSFRDHMFAFSNMLAPLAEKLDLDLSNLIDAVNFGYSRNVVPKPSPGVGGPCLSKDPYLLDSVFAREGIEAPLLRANRAINEAAPALLRAKLQRLLGDAGKDLETARIALVGMAFKGSPATSDLRCSTSLWFLDQLPERANVRVYDPVVEDDDIRALGVEPVGLEDAFRAADAVVVLNNHASYRNWNLPSLCALLRQPAVFIDAWHMFDPLTLKQLPGIAYGGIGND